MNSNKPSTNTLNLLLKYEVGGGEEYYTKFLSKFTWPGGASGPTIAIGIDCGYYSKEELSEIFSFISEKESLEMIKQASGKVGERGKEYAKVLRKTDIVVPWSKALDIFEQYTWPKFTKLAEKTFPGLESLRPDAYGAVVSLVFNRGTSLIGDKRIEMRNIKELIPTKNYKKIAQEFRSMKRIWRGKNLNGLLERREAEAKLIESIC